MQRHRDPTAAHEYRLSDGRWLKISERKIEMHELPLSELATHAPLRRRCGHKRNSPCRHGLLGGVILDRMEGTAEENKAAVQGANPHWGRYSVNESDKTILFKIEHAFFSNWEGTEQKRPFTLAGDQLTWIAAASTGGRAELVWRRAK
jgi:hypothetical protein